MALRMRRKKQVKIKITTCNEVDFLAIDESSQIKDVHNA
jgi:hypothetical protein